MNYSRIDVHHHIVPDFYKQELAGIGITEGGGVKFPEWDVKKALASMKSNGIDKGMMSVSLPGVYFGDKKQSIELARRCNEFIAEKIKENPGKFGGFASIPFPLVDEALEEIKYSLDTLGLDGLILLSNVDGIYLGDERYKKIFEELNRRKAVVFVHPDSPKKEMDSKLLNPFYWWFMDTSKSIMSYIQSGYHKTFKDITFIFAHAGGVLPKVYEKIGKALEKTNPNIHKELAEFKRNIYIDTAKSFGRNALEALFEFMPQENILFGSDYIWANSAKVKYWIGIMDMLEAEGAALDKVYDGNAKRIFSGQKIIPSAPRPLPRKTAEKKNIAHEHFVTQNLKASMKKLGHEKHTVTAESINKMYKGVETVYLSMDIPELWGQPAADIRSIMKQYNQDLAQERGFSGNIKKLGAIDAVHSNNALRDIDYCVNELGLDGVMLYIDISDTQLQEVFPSELNTKIKNLNMPVVFHPVDATGEPICNEKYLDTVYLVAKLFYLNQLEIFENDNIILTHTAEIHNYLDENIGMLYYLQLEKWKLGKFIIDQMIKKKPMGTEIVKNLRYTD